jgi:hypothetical protein
MLCCIHWDLVWAAVAAIGAIGAAIATLWLVIVGLRQIGDLNTAGSETFLQNLKKDFFTEEARYILALAENELLEFHIGVIDPAKNPKKEFGFFEIKSSPSQQLEKMLRDLSFKEGTLISTYEMDDYLLQHLEDIGFLYKKKRVDIYNIDQLFGYYIESVFESAEIQKYIAWARKDSDDIYSNFVLVYNDLTEYLKQKAS